MTNCAVRAGGRSAERERTARTLIKFKRGVDSDRKGGRGSRHFAESEEMIVLRSYFTSKSAKEDLKIGP